MKIRYIISFITLSIALFNNCNGYNLQFLDVYPAEQLIDTYIELYEDIMNAGTIGDYDENSILFLQDMKDILTEDVILDISRTSYIGKENVINLLKDQSLYTLNVLKIYNPSKLVDYQSYQSFNGEMRYNLTLNVRTQTYQTNLDHVSKFFSSRTSQIDKETFSFTCISSSHACLIKKIEIQSLQSKIKISSINAIL